MPSSYCPTELEKKLLSYGPLRRMFLWATFSPNWHLSMAMSYTYMKSKAKCEVKYGSDEPPPNFRNEKVRINSGVSGVEKRQQLNLHDSRDHKRPRDDIFQRDNAHGHFMVFTTKKQGTKQGAAHKVRTF